MAYSFRGRHGKEHDGTQADVMPELRALHLDSEAVGS